MQDGKVNGSPGFDVGFGKICTLCSRGRLYTGYPIVCMKRARSRYVLPYNMHAGVPVQRIGQPALAEADKIE